MNALKEIILWKALMQLPNSCCLNRKAVLRRKTKQKSESSPFTQTSLPWSSCHCSSCHCSSCHCSLFLRPLYLGQAVLWERTMWPLLNARTVARPNTSGSGVAAFCCFLVLQFSCHKSHPGSLLQYQCLFENLLVTRFTYDHLYSINSFWIIFSVSEQHWMLREALVIFSPIIPYQ